MPKLKENKNIMEKSSNISLTYYLQIWIKKLFGATQKKKYCEFDVTFTSITQ